MLASLPRRLQRAFPLAAATAIALGMLAGCQSYETGIEVICQAPVRCVECREAPPELRSMKYAEHMERLVRNGKAQDFLGSVATMEPKARIEALRAEAKAANLSECPLADFFEQAEFAAEAARAGAAADGQPSIDNGNPAEAGEPVDAAETGTGGDTDGTGDAGDGGDTGDTGDTTGGEEVATE